MVGKLASRFQQFRTQSWHEGKQAPVGRDRTEVRAGQLEMSVQICLLCRPTMILYKIGNIRDLFGHKVLFHFSSQLGNLPRSQPVLASFASFSQATVLSHSTQMCSIGCIAGQTKRSIIQEASAEPHALKYRTITSLLLTQCWQFHDHRYPSSFTDHLTLSRR